MADPIPDAAGAETRDDAAEDLAASVAAAARAEGCTLAVAESLTGGLLSSALARAEGAGEWFRGGVVAYSSEVKHSLLSVRPGPVVAEGAAVDMAQSAARLLGADAAVAVTGAGGPDPQDGQPAGTVWVAVTHAGATRTHLHRFDGDPGEVCRRTVVSALEHLLTTIG